MTQFSSALAIESGYLYAAPNSLFSHNGAGHANTNIIYLITEVMYNSFTVAVDMDIHGYLCVDIILGTATEVIGPINGIRIINDFTICVCLEDADILLLLRMFYAFLFFFSYYSSFSPNLRSLLLSGNERDNLNFNAMRRMVSLRGRLLQNMFNLI